METARPSRTGSPISSPSSNPDGTQEDLRTWSERKHPPPPPPPLLVQPVSRKVPGCGLVKCIFCLSQFWLVPVKPGATGSGEALSRSSPIKFVEFMTQQVLVFYLFIFKIPPLLILSILQARSNAARFTSPTLVGPSWGDTGSDNSRAEITTIQRPRWGQRRSSNTSEGPPGTPRRCAPHRGCKAPSRICLGFAARHIYAHSRLGSHHPPRMLLRVLDNPFPIGSSSQGLGSLAWAGMQSLQRHSHPLAKPLVAGQPANSVAP